MDMNSWDAFWFFWGSAMLVFVAIMVVVYVVQALATQRALRILGYDKPWLAWIPLGNLFALAEVTGDDVAVLWFGIQVPMKAFRFWWLANFVCTLIPIVGGLLSLLITVMCLTWTYSRVYSALDGVPYENEMLIAVLSAFIGIIPIIKFFAAKDNGGRNNRGGYKDDIFDINSGRWE